jgi:hypothetical protein
MHLDSRSKAVLGTLSLVGLLAALAAGGGSATAAAPAHAAACQKATNIEAIIDDSGSMFDTDFNKNRTRLLDAFAALQPNQGKILGAVEFGDTADVLFAPAAIPGVVPAMDASFAKVDADNGGTDYNAAFTAAKLANPQANGRIFLSDGDHNVGTYNNGHANPPIKTDTVGFGTIDPTLLQRIANDTGGTAFTVDDSSQVPAVAAGITADMNCKRPPIVFVDTFTRQGQSFGHKFKPKGKSADILLTWPDALTSLDVIKFNQPRRKAGKAVAQVARVKARKKRGATFVTVHLKKLKKGVKVRFKVKARSLSGATVATTSVIR